MTQIDIKGHSQTCTELRKLQKLRDFQYRFLLLKIVTNQQLEEWNLGEKWCSFCKSEVETYEHLFIKCKFVEPLWLFLLELAKENNIVIEVTFANILCNDVHENVNHVLNFMALMLKQYIYKKRCAGDKPVVQSFRKMIEEAQDLSFF